MAATVWTLESVTCSFCQEVMLSDAVKTKCCQNIFCENCYHILLYNKDQACPFCRRDKLEVSKDEAMSKFLQEMKVRGLGTPNTENVPCEICPQDAPNLKATEICWYCLRALCPFHLVLSHGCTIKDEDFEGKRFTAPLTFCPIIRERMTCKRHDRRMVYLCQKHQTLACLECVWHNHGACDDSLVFMEKSLPYTRAELHSFERSVPTQRSTWAWKGNKAILENLTTEVASFFDSLISEADENSKTPQVPEGATYGLVPLWKRKRRQGEIEPSLHFLEEMKDLKERLSRLMDATILNHERRFFTPPNSPFLEFKPVDKMTAKMVWRGNYLAKGFTISPQNIPSPLIYLEFILGSFMMKSAMKVSFLGSSLKSCRASDQTLIFYQKEEKRLHFRSMGGNMRVGMLVNMLQRSAKVTMLGQVPGCINLEWDQGCGIFELEAYCSPIHLFDSVHHLDEAGMLSN